MTRRSRRCRDASITRLAFTCFHLEGSFGNYAPVEVIATRGAMRVFADRR